MIVDGKTLASNILAEVKKRAGAYPSPLVVRAVSVAPTKATESYLRIKTARASGAGMRLEVVRLEEPFLEEKIIESIVAPGADAVLVQLPLPAHLDVSRVCDNIPPALDADVLSKEAYRAFIEGEETAIIPPVAQAVKEILSFAGVSLSGKRIAIIGRGRLVGEPVAALLSLMGETVSVFDKGDAYEDTLHKYDVIISGAGVPGLIRPELIKKGVVLIDAGTSESHGVIVGDVDPACEEVASVCTPVPGGVGPVAVACLFKNVLALKER